MENLFGGVPGLLVLGAWGVGGRDYSDTNLQRIGAVLTSVSFS